MVSLSSIICKILTIFSAKDGFIDHFLLQSVFIDHFLCHTLDEILYVCSKMPAVIANHVVKDKVFLYANLLIFFLTSK